MMEIGLSARVHVVKDARLDPALHVSVSGGLRPVVMTVQGGISRRQQNGFLLLVGVEDREGVLRLGQQALLAVHYSAGPLC